MDFYRPPTTQGTINALGSVYRALRAWRFYPKGHPTRRNSLKAAHETMLRLLDGNTLSLACGRSGFSFPDKEFLKDDSRLSTSLAFELFIRRVQKIIFLHDLFEEDLLELLRVLSVPPEIIQQSGGMDMVMAERGIRTILVNEFDLAVIRGKRRQIELSGVVPQGLDEPEYGVDRTQAVELPLAPSDSSPPEQQIQELLARISDCTDDDVYLILNRQAVSCADLLLSRCEHNLIFPLVELLADHAADDMRSTVVRECALFSIEQIVTGGGVLEFAFSRLEKGYGISKKTLLAIVKSGGTATIKSAVELMAGTNNLKTRKILSTTLGSLDETAVPVLLDMIHDSRWFITRNICAILGAIRDRMALTALTECLNHQDLRVRKESIRSLAQLGGQEAEKAILGILHGDDTALYPQAIASLGGMKSRTSLAELMIIVFSRDIFLKALSLKIDALAAIAAIGDQQVTPHLVTLLEERNLLAAARRRKLRAAVAVCLGRLGDARALPSLRKFAADGGELGTACIEAIIMIEKSEGIPDGLS